LTKKAVVYYIEQGLACPAIMENGYRDFSENDVERLRKISILRGLGLAVSDIQMVLENQSGGALNKVSHTKDMELSELREKQSLIENLRGIMIGKMLRRS
jgi:DNA-binding transcriptional MerR regulator